MLALLLPFSEISCLTRPPDSIWESNSSKMASQVPERLRFTGHVSPA